MTSVSILDALMQELASARGGATQKGMLAAQKAAGFPSGTPSTPYYTGPGGLWGVVGLERDVISTRVHPKGLAGMLPARPTNIINPMYPYITGFLAPTGSDPNGVCDDPMTAGPMKNCLTTASFGRYSYQTRELELNRLGQRINNADFQDFNILNDPLFGGSDVGGPATGPRNIDAQTVLANEVKMRMIELGVAFQDRLAKQVFQGNPVNNKPGGGYAEFPGLDLQITTGYKDALSGVTCPSLDAYIYDFNYNSVNSATSAADIIKVFTYTARYIKHNARTMNFDPVTWAIAMREELFYELTQLWACSYMFTRCDVGQFPNTTVDRVVANGSDINDFRDEMRNGQYLIIDGIRWPVVFDDGIHEDSNTNNNKVVSGAFASDVYFIPITARGGYALTYWEYFDFGGTNAMFDVLGNGSAPGYQNMFWTDGGMYAWHAKPPVNWCIQYLAKIEPRLIFRAPHLSARLKNLVYAPFLHTREPFRTDPYNINGGNTDGRPAPSLYKQYSDPTPFL